MTKQIEIHGQRVTLFSTDEGRTWASCAQSIIAYDQRKTSLRLDLRKGFARIDGMQNPDNVESETP